MFEEFPVEEYRSRLHSTRQGMKRHNLDALLLSTEANCRYLAGLVNVYWTITMANDLQLALVPGVESEDPILLLPDHLRFGSAQSSWIKDRRGWSQFSTESMAAPVKSIVDVIVEKGLERGTIGMEIGKDSRLGMSLVYFQELSKALPGCNFVDCDNMMGEVRMVKTPAEIAIIRRACEINCEGMIAGMQAVREGVSEIEVGNAITKRWCEVTDDFSCAHPWQMHINSSSQRNQWFDCGPSDYRLKKGNYIVMDLCYCYKGYWSDMFRTACIGEPDPLLEKCFNANRLGNLAGMEIIAPGVAVRDIALTIHNKWRELGLEAEIQEQVVDHNGDFAGHSSGLTIHEHPFVNSKETRKLEPGMHLMIEGMLMDRKPFSESTVCVGIEDSVLVVETGHERLTEMVPDELFIK